ncbi:hypothetical protein HY570_03485 [Candidatus Micrarchaeota archaeon]|nr:hypothetical protein [Candidatus Micrarchaeota archaeon]
MRNEVEMAVEIENLTSEASWAECDVIVPPSLSLAPDKELGKGRLRIGIINPKEIRTGKCKIYAGAKSYPDVYIVKLVAYGFGRDGAIVGREEKRVDLRCEALG